MPVTFTETEAVFTGECKVADADALYEWLQKHPEGRVRMGACLHFHTALLQVMMAVKATIVEPPANPLLRRWIFGLSQESNSSWAEPPVPVLQVVQEGSVMAEPVPAVQPAPARVATRNTRSRRRSTTSTTGMPSRKEDVP